MASEVRDNPKHGFPINDLIRLTAAKATSPTIPVMTRPHTVSGLRFHGLNVVDILKGQIVRESQTFFNCCANVCLHSLEME